jgi:hypothetical protein
MEVIEQVFIVFLYLAFGGHGYKSKVHKTRTNVNGTGLDDLV